MPSAAIEPLAKFLPLVLDKLLLLMVKPPAFPLASGQAAVGQAAFKAVADIVNKITNTVSDNCNSVGVQFLEQQKQVCFQKTHNQGFGQLFLTVSWDLCA